MKVILGISAYYHDSAAAISINGKIVAAAQEERFTREKHTEKFPSHAIKYCLEESGYSINELDAIVFYDKPLLKFERLLQTYYEFSPKGLISFLKAMPLWIKSKLFLKKIILNELNEIESFEKKKLKLLFTEHHLSHSASAFFPSCFEESAILTIDGVGEWCTASIGIGNKNGIKIIKEMHFPHSVGLLYSAFTYFLGFKVNSGEYKLMGLAPFGNEYSEQTKNFIQLIKKELIDIKTDGSIWVNQKYFNYATGLTMINKNKWEDLFGIKQKEINEEFRDDHNNLALAIQTVLEEIVILMVKETKSITDSENLCMAGGVALNCVSNGKILNTNIFKNIFIQPASGDAGAAIGAALAANYIYYNEKRTVDPKNDELNGSFLGPQFSSKEIQLLNKRVKAVYTQYEEYITIAEFVAKKITEGNVIGWFQDKMEFGPRALGNRSILADARNKDMQSIINIKIKYREGFRPFAPAVLEEDRELFFKLSVDSPYMLFVSDIRESLKMKLPDDYQSLSLWEKLRVKRSQLPAITHVDQSARVQTVSKRTNPKLWILINEFKRLTGVGLLINTSFNVRGEPIVCTPFDAYRCFMSTDMDYLIIGEFVYKKKEQPEWNSKEKWRVRFEND